MFECRATLQVTALSALDGCRLAALCHVPGLGRTEIRGARGVGGERSSLSSPLSYQEVCRVTALVRKFGAQDEIIYGLDFDRSGSDPHRDLKPAVDALCCLFVCRFLTGVHEAVC